LVKLNKLKNKNDNRMMIKKEKFKINFEKDRVFLGVNYKIKFKEILNE